MDISQFINPSQTEQSRSSENGSNNFAGALDDGLDREAFLKMLVAQLNNQDPLNPQEGHEFAAQLAQFSTVEQLQSLNKQFAGQSEILEVLQEEFGDQMTTQNEKIESLRSGMQLNRATSLIGQTIETKGNQVSWSGSGAAPLNVHFDKPAATATVTVRDSDGNVVRTLEATDIQQGPQTFPWDGMMDDGETAPPGAYTFQVRAEDSNGNRVPTETITIGTVDRVSFEGDGKALLWMGNVSIPLSEVRSMYNQ